MSLVPGIHRQSHKSADRKTRAVLPTHFRALMTRNQNEVIRTLQASGYWKTTEKTANQVDWQHCLTECLSEIAYEARFDLDDPIVIKAMQTKLAILAAVCEMWAGQLEGES